MSGAILAGVIRPALCTGRYQIACAVDELGVAGRYRCRLYSRRDGRLIREVWSDASGSALFTDLAYEPQGYVATGYDHGADPVNAAISDLITPEPMA